MQKITFGWLNMLCFFAGIIGVWIFSHSVWALIFCWIAALHFEAQVRQTKPGEKPSAKVRFGWPSIVEDAETIYQRPERNRA